MNDLSEKKKKANDLRKKFNYTDALPIYRDLWKENCDEFDGSGLLHCLRKLNLFDEALPLADDLIKEYPNFNWCRIEVIWTYIQGELGKLDKGASREQIVQLANKIMNLNPDPLAAKVVTLKVLKLAKYSRYWDILDEWTNKINPNLLSPESEINASGKKSWSERSRWYYYRSLALLNRGQTDDALNLIDDALKCFPMQAKFFLRQKAEVFLSLGDLGSAEKAYKQICSSKKVDWWLLHRYSLLLAAKGQKEEALQLMYQAASMNYKLELMVKLFADIGDLCKHLGKNEEARAHLVLSRYIREQKGWSRSEILLEIEDLNKSINDNDCPRTLNEAFDKCKSYWSKDRIQGCADRKRNVRHNLIGTVILGPPDRPFCFINAGDEVFFCYKSDLPTGIRNEDKVRFDGVPSFDKKKNRDSWKAAHIFSDKRKI